MKLVVYGALGRMGKNIIRLASYDPEIEITGAVDPSETTIKDICEISGTDSFGFGVEKDLERVISRADVVIDFTTPEASLLSAGICAQHNVPLVVGTTGFSPELRSNLLSKLRNIPCVFAPNMSVGVNVLFKLSEIAASILGESYDIEISETHHRFKKDAPSGTALKLAEIVAKSRGIDLEKNAVYGRKGLTGERKPDEIGIHVLRSGDVVGEHTVTFGTIGETIELTHRAHSRDSLASGAIKAAKFVHKAKPGLYDMQDVLGLKL
jgi:4-hydroxy-tetrahydrodipicolinate reductase